LVVLYKNEATVYYDAIHDKSTIVQLVNDIKNVVTPPIEHSISIPIKSKMDKSTYLEKVAALKQHIQLGDIYEVNFCQEFFAENVTINPINYYLLLNKKSPTPFSCFVKHHDKYLLCASPERFIQKNGSNIISQPIKGTIKRGLTTKEDEQLKQQLISDKKERSENIMIVDLVRNDLSKIAKKNTVEVDELCGIYTFPQVHQMISTIKAKLQDNTTFDDIIKALFPMGSMTGAPKISAMQLIEKYETTKRGLYSGSVGYINSEGDFDFNVVIRSLAYNSQSGYLSFMVGGAITALSDPEKEYEECLLKAKAMMEVLQPTIVT
jgi:para-aminobenzoate synthetase component 1